MKETMELMVEKLDIPESEEVFFAHDDTVFKTCKCGFVITENGIYRRDAFSTQTFFFPFSELSDVYRFVLDDLRILAVYGDNHMRVAVSSFSLMGEETRDNLAVALNVICGFFKD